MGVGGDVGGPTMTRLARAINIDSRGTGGGQRGGSGTLARSDVATIQNGFAFFNPAHGLENHFHIRFRAILTRVLMLLTTSSKWHTCTDEPAEMEVNV